MIFEMDEKKKLNPLFMSELRLSIMSILIGADEVDFNFIKESTGATSGNISVQGDNLEKAGYITIKKTFDGKRPKTIYSITDYGKIAFAEHYEALKSYFV